MKCHIQLKAMDYCTKKMQYSELEHTLFNLNVLKVSVVFTGVLLKLLTFTGWGFVGPCLNTLCCFFAHQLVALMTGILAFRFVRKVSIRVVALDAAMLRIKDFLFVTFDN